MPWDQLALIKHNWEGIEIPKQTVRERFYDELWTLDLPLVKVLKSKIEPVEGNVIDLLMEMIGLCDQPEKLYVRIKQLDEKNQDYGLSQHNFEMIHQGLSAAISSLTCCKAIGSVSTLLGTWQDINYFMENFTNTRVIENNVIDNRQSVEPTTAESGEKEMSKSKSSNSDVNSDLYQRVVSSIQTPVMSVDTDLIVTYVNKASLDLLKQCEDTFKKRWPDFRAEEDFIMGLCIDMFHENPAHQRKILADPTNLPYTTDITVDDLTIELNVSAIMDAQGNYQGCTLEWANVTDIRRQEEKASQLQSAINTSGTATMMIDRDLNITYYNEASLALLKEHEGTFAKKWPSFKATDEFLMGTCIDAFHENPEHQRKILNDVNNLPWKADIAIEHLTIELKITAIIDLMGNYIGCSLEWSDVTEARRQAEKAAQLQGAINNSGTATMMIDRDLNITYYNQATLSLLKEHEERLHNNGQGLPQRMSS